MIVWQNCTKNGSYFDAWHLIKYDNDTLSLDGSLGYFTKENTLQNDQ